MKNLKYFPFERNRYFYGKLLSVDDFEAEQRYMNDKRRMLNRFLYGTGVVCGMQVVEVDDLTVSLERGLALDFSGREIVVASPVTKRLSAIEGYSRYAASGGERQELYLCIAYDEQMKEPIHNISRVNDEQEEEFNKYQEGYRLFVTEEEPDSEGEQISELYENTQTVFQGNGIRIRQKVPKYIQSNTEAEITIFVEKTEQTKPVSFSYQMNLSCVEQQEKHVAVISFDENQFASSDTYVFQSCIRAKAVENIEGYLEVIPNSFVLTIGEDTKRDLIKGRFSVSITDTDVRHMILKNYYAAAMEDILKNTYEQAIYLARLKVIRAGDTYVIDGVENLPFKQYVWNNILSGAMESIRLRENPVGKQIEFPYVSGMSSKKVLPDQRVEIRTGSTIIDLGVGGITGQRFCSGEIIHELGLGEVFVSLGLSRGVQENNQVIYGSRDVFEDSVCPKVELAARVNMEKGSFVIGVKCLEQVDTRRLRVYWMAVKDKTSQRQEKKIIHLSVRPDIVNLQVRESCYFEAVIGDEVQRHVKWSVKEEEGGIIDTNGCYTAPNQSGVYEVMAVSQEDQQLKAATFVIVRDII